METLFLYTLLVTAPLVVSEQVVSYSDLSTLISLAKDGYFDLQTLVPVSYTNSTMNVTLDISLSSVNAFNEIGGYLEISGYLEVKWTDQSSGRRSDVTILMPSASVWKPPLLLVNSIKGTSEIGDKTSKIRCNLQRWNCEWKPRIILRGACTPDVRFYPFDRQTCSLKIAAWGHTASELKLTSVKSEWDMEFYEENAEWTVESTSSDSYDKKNVSFVEFTIQLKRIPTYYVINLIAPVILLTLVNVCVFILPAESGERVGFSITCFLSFVFLMNIFMGFIPSSSVDLAYLCYYTFIMMIFSCGMSLATVFTLWIHFKSENTDSKVPVVLFGFIYLLKCRCFYFTSPKRRNKVSDVVPIKLVPADSIWDEKYFDPDYIPEDEARDKEPEWEVTWKDVASVMDIFFLLGFLAGQIFYSIAYLLPIILNK